jgi:hypothetical protein
MIPEGTLGLEKNWIEDCFVDGVQGFLGEAEELHDLEGGQVGVGVGNPERKSPLQHLHFRSEIQNILRYNLKRSESVVVTESVDQVGYWSPRIVVWTLVFVTT